MADIKFEENSHEKNEILEQTVEPETDLKTVLLDYIGEKHNPEDNSVTVHMIIETMAKEFPEFVLAVAEENFIRGYNQALLDTDTNLLEQRNAVLAKDEDQG
jgi:hypothetical protein|tara:strand:- start:759 stop:1064 length:306 start_codon:yes stop_codon:yes gene_type:complete